jgi:hypothetical protein
MPTYRDVPVWVHGLLPPIPLLLETGALAVGRPFHQQFFKGEFGLYEILTVVFASLASLLAFLIVLQRPKLTVRGLSVWLILFALGALYLAGEEASWGQHLFGWESVNDQEETNLHNLREFAFTNEVPRNLLTLFVIFGGVLVPLAFRQKIHGEGREGRFSYWFWPTRVTLVCSLFLLLPPVPKKLGLPSMPEPGETEEFYMSMFLALYASSIYIRKRRHLAGPKEVSSEA